MRQLLTEPHHYIVVLFIELASTVAVHRVVHLNLAVLLAGDRQDDPVLRVEDGGAVMDHDDRVLLQLVEHATTVIGQEELAGS